MAMKALTVSVLTCALLSGCVAKNSTGPGLSQDQLNATLEQQQQAYVEQVSAICVSPEQVTQVQQELATLNGKLEQMDETSAVVTPVPVAKVCPKSAIGDKLVLGEVEMTYVDEIGAGFATRIDTGAESSSVDARNIRPFERDGKDWVRFDMLIGSGEEATTKTVEARVVRNTRIKQQAGQESERRPVILAHIQIGEYKAETELNLTDRSHLEYPLLLGRKFMKDIAVVDVSKKFVHGKTAPTPKKAASKK
nr:RimK/LysX family protein [Paraferrimonas haliotis]